MSSPKSPGVVLLALLATTLLTRCQLVDPGGTTPGGPREGYPAGPYDVTEGSTIADLELVDSDGTAFRLQDIYRDGGNRLLLISTAAGWCSVCIEEQPSLQELHELHGDRGLYVMVSVFEDALYTAADAAYAARWQQQHEVDFTVVADPTPVFADYYDTSLTPMVMMVDVDTMKILRIMTGWDRSVVSAIIEARL